MKIASTNNSKKLAVSAIPARVAGLIGAMELLDYFTTGGCLHFPVRVTYCESSATWFLIVIEIICVFVVIQYHYLKNKRKKGKDNR
jgi:hypothetical protein